ncbi:MAG: T9SS type A sorting domain-containing protein, partial [Bacteroidota bacterium]
DRDRVTLTSPPMDLSDYDFPVMSFSYWFFSGLGNSTPNDNLEIILTNGTDEVVIEQTPDISLGGWVDRSEIRVADFITPSDSMHIIITTRDNPSPGHWVEGGFDAFLVTDDMPSSTTDLLNNPIQVSAFPNPFDDQITVQYTFEGREAVQLSLFNVLGQRLRHTSLTQPEGTLAIGEELGKGVYFIHLESDGEQLKVLKVVKQ